MAYLETPDGRVAYRYWPEAHGARKTLLGIHGLGGNNDNFIALGEALKPDVAVYAIDLAGNGESGVRGDVESVDVHLRNLETLEALIRSRHPGAAHYLAGYSLGGAYAPAWHVRSGCDHRGLILFAPPYRNVFMLPPHWRFVLRAAAAIAPRRYIRMGPPSNGHLDPRYRFETASDKFIRRRTLRSLKVSADMVPLGERALPLVTIPTLIVHGDADPAAFPEGARLTHARLGATDKTLHWIPGAKHDLYDVLSGVKCSDIGDARRALVIDPVKEWLRRH